MSLTATEISLHDILLVEDEPALRSMLGQFLEHSGYSVHEVENGRAALRYLETQSVRLVLTDIFMPQADGLEVLTKLRRMRPDLPIIAMSGSMTGDLKLFLKIARHLGAKHTLIKPFPLPNLLTAVRETIGWSK